MAIPTSLSGSYVGVESFRRASNMVDTSRDATILEHLLAASREIERLTLRRFFPYTTTAYLRWPQLSPQSSWVLWMPDDLLSVTTLQAAVSGTNASPVALTHYYLEPNDIGPPFSRIELDLSANDSYQSGPTPQRSISVLGQFGYCNTTVAAGTLTAAISSTSATTLTCSDPTKIDQGDVLLIDSEAIYVDAPRSPAGATLATIQRGVNGTTPATHLNGAAILKYQAPANVRRVVRADAIGSFQQDLANWGRTIGQGDMEVEYQGKHAKSMRQTVVDEYARRRLAVI